MSIYITLVSFICTVFGFFSRTPDMLMASLVSERKSKLCSIVQRIFNYSVCVVIIICGVKDFLEDTVLWTLWSFGIQLVVNFMYTLLVIVVYYTSKKD